jgi:hypothetical protein
MRGFLDAINIVASFSSFAISVFALRVGAMPLGNTTKLFVYTCGLLGSSATDRREGQNMGTRSFLSTKAQWLNKDATMR